MAENKVAIPLNGLSTKIRVIPQIHKPITANLTNLSRSITLGVNEPPGIPCPTSTMWKYSVRSKFFGPN